MTSGIFSGDSNFGGFFRGIGSGIGDAWDSLWGKDPARTGGIYGGPVGPVGVPGYGGRAGRLLDGRRDYSDFRGQQQDQVNRLLEMSRMGDPLARARLQEQADANASRSQAQALAMGPQNQALGARMAMQQGSLGQRDAAGKAAMADTAARLGATQQLTGALQGMRQQDQALNLGMSQLELQQAIAQGQLGLGREGEISKRFAATMGTPTTGEQWRSMAAGGLTFLGMLSDRTKKADIKDGGAAADAFMSKLKARTYKYKDEDYMSGEQLGIMAQDLEKSELGKGAVVKTPQGKMVDIRKLSSGLAASVVRLNDRLSKLESKG